MKDHNKSIFLVLFSLLSLILLPGLAFAQPVECCKLTHDFEFEGISYNMPSSGYLWVRENTGTCDTTGVTSQCRTTPGTQSSNCYTAKWGILCLLNTVMTVTDWVFYALIVITAFLVILGGFTIATAGGDPSRVDTGKNYILYAMIGLAVALLSRAIPAMVKGLVA
jgi:hypothetical protein